MDVGAIIAGLQSVISFVLGYISSHVHSEEQWMLLGAGALLIVLGAYSAWRARKIASYKLSVLMVKIGFALVFLAIGWDNARAIYNDAVAAFGSPLAGILAVFASGMIGYELIKAIIRRKQG